MEWGAFWHGGVLPLQRIQGTLNTERYLELLQNDLLPLFLTNVNLTYRQDNARCHVSRLAHNWLHQNGIHLMIWPLQSPDLNPIENLWSKVKRELDKVPIGNTQCLFSGAQRIWRHVIPNSVPALLESLPRRVQEVLRNHGGHTHY